MTRPDEGPASGRSPDALEQGEPKERIGFIGLGTMGRSMAANLARAGYPLTAWNRTPGREQELSELAVRRAASPHGLATAVDVVMVCISDTPDVESVLFGEHGVYAGLRPGMLVIDCSTISPAATRRFAARLHSSGVAFIDAPVSGGSEGARAGTLTFFVGGEVAHVERARPILEAMGSTITHMGEVGSGQAAKAVNQVILCGVYLGVAEGLVLGMKYGLDLDALVQALAGGAAQSWVLANRSGRMIANEYPLGFKLSLHRKDLAIALEMARVAGATLPVAALAEQLENGLIARGYGDEDVSALARGLREWAGL